jgi:hypothetical protein
MESDALVSVLNGATLMTSVFGMALVGMSVSNIAAREVPWRQLSALLGTRMLCASLIVGALAEFLNVLSRAACFSAHATFADRRQYSRVHVYQEKRERICRRIAIGLDDVVMRPAGGLVHAFGQGLTNGAVRREATPQARRLRPRQTMATLANLVEMANNVTEARNRTTFCAWSTVRGPGNVAQKLAPKEERLRGCHLSECTRGR